MTAAQHVIDLLRVPGVAQDREKAASGRRGFPAASRS
jgi:hypothetical protein